MFLREGDKILVAHRRLFEKDETRFFIGRVDAYEFGVVKATGHSYVRDRVSGKMLGKADTRTKLLSLSSGTLFVYQLPPQVTLDGIRFVSDEGRLSLMDGQGYTMNLTEYTHGGRV
jgi:hypothetical protein